MSDTDHRNRSSSERESASPSQSPALSPLSTSTPAGGAAVTITTAGASKGGVGNPIKNMIRRRSVELGRLMEGGAGASKRNNDARRASQDQDASQEASGAAREQSDRSDYPRSTSPFISQPIPVISPSLSPAATSPPTVVPRPGRRPAFALGLPWRPQSEYSMNGASGLRSGLTRAQRRFASAFPELADLVMVPSAYCAPCLATPPPTPPVTAVPATAPSSLSPLPSPSLTATNTIVSPSGTANTLTSNSTLHSSSSTSMSALASAPSTPCPGHFNDFACALEREILWQGTLYVTATHICFYGRHFGKTVRVMVDYQDLVSVEKEKKMGVFPSSIRIRVRTPPTQEGDEGDANSAAAATPSTKDYVFTSLMSREQAYAIIERNRRVHQQVMNNLLSSPIVTPGISGTDGFVTPRTETPELMERQTTLMFDLDIEARRVRSAVNLREQRRRSPRTYSVVTDEAFSGIDNMDRPPLQGRLSTSRIFAVSTMASDAEEAKDAVAAVTTDSSASAGSGSDADSGPDAGDSSRTNSGIDADTMVERKAAEETATPRTKDMALTPSPSSSVTSATSSEKQQEAIGLRSFLQSRTSQLKRVMSSDGNGSTVQLVSNSQDYQRDGITTRLVPELAYPSPAPTSPISIHAFQSSSSIRSVSSSNHNQQNCGGSISGQSKSGRSSTPPILISPSMTTTKVSHSSSTVQSLAEPGTCRNMSVHLRKDSREALLDSSKADMRATRRMRSQVATLSKAKAKAKAKARRAATMPHSPVDCGCQQHYKNAVASTVIPLPLDLCFELLFSGRGAGQGDKLACDAHRIKDGSTEVKIGPWQKDEASAKPTNGAWEGLKRNLEFSVTFKVPMLAKASTQCFEVQQVTQYSDYVILVHLDSRTPNVPYGEHFTTVAQVCLTWESTLRTRVKCFMEVKFKKSVMWASRVESGALEGAGGFLKEFIKQLQDLAEAQGPQLIRTWESNKQAEDASADSDDSEDSEDESDESDCESDTESDVHDDHDEVVVDDDASTTGSAGTRVAKTTTTTTTTTETASTRSGSGSSMVSVARRPVTMIEMSRAQSLLSQQFLRSAPHMTTTTTTTTTAASESTKTGSPARLSLDSARPENAGVCVKDQLTPLLPSERKSALATFWENLTPPISTVAAAALTFGENKVAPVPAITAASASTAVAHDAATKGIASASSTTTTTAHAASASASSVPTGVSAVTPSVATGVPSSPVWGEFVRKGLTFFGKSVGPDASLSSVLAANGNGTKDRTNEISGLSESDDGSRPDGVRVKFALPAGSRRSNSKSVDGKEGGRSSVRSYASVPSLDSTYREGRRQPRSSSQSLSVNGGGKEVVAAAAAAAVAMAATAVAVQSPSSKGDHRSWLLSRMIFGFVVLGMAITALNVWHLFTIVSSVIEVVQQRNDLLSNGHLQSPPQSRPQQQQQQQQQPRRVYSPYPPRYPTHPSRYQFVRELYQQWQQQQQQHDSYYQQNQAWVSDEDFKAWNQQASFHGSDVEDPQQGSPFPAPEASPMTSPPTLDESWEQQQQQQQQGDEAKEPTLPLNVPLETVQLQKEQLKAEIAELLAMLEHARKEVHS
ncbi:hypothetical protein BGX31_000125 [Mortierella sp. GBA43]|nr:hypothetical protein BGX31_000125 [Mortierella sp. GBA43]